MLRVVVAAGVLAGVLGWAGTAQAGTVLKVDGGKARVSHDPLVPPASKTRLPAVRQRTRLLAPRAVARAAALPWARPSCSSSTASSRA